MPQDPDPQRLTQAEETLARPDLNAPGARPPSADDTLRLHAQSGLPQLPGYEVLQELGRGGMGVVYRARQKGLNRLVALKVILHADHASSEERQRFMAEAEVVARVQH